MINETYTSHQVDPSRVINVFGPVTGRAVAELLPKIQHLRSLAGDPIMVHIDSGGGGVREFQKLKNALNERNVQGVRCPVVTFALGIAGSVAAYLLVTGNHASALRGSRLSFHGVSFDAKNLKDIKSETALVMALRLDRENRQIARMLAESMVYRLAARGQFWPPGSGKIGQRGTRQPLLFLRQLTDRMTAHLSTAVSRSLVADAFAQAKMLCYRAGNLASLPMAKSRRVFIAEEAQLLAGALSRSGQNASAEWPDSESAVAEWILDYRFLQEVLCEGRPGIIHDLRQKFGVKFLRPSEVDACNQKRSKGRASASSSLRATASIRILVLWYFSISFCRKLLIGENLLPAEDACTLGLIDVVASRLNAGQITPTKPGQPRAE